MGGVLRKYMRLLSKVHFSSDAKAVQIACPPKLINTTKEGRQLGTFSRVVIFVQGQILMCFS